MAYRKSLLNQKYKKGFSETSTLANVLNAFNIPEHYYSFGSYREEAVCIEKTNNSWIVYEGERGKQFNLKSYRDIQQACCDLISRIAESDQQEKKMQQSFFIEQRQNIFQRGNTKDRLLKLIKSYRHSETAAVEK